MHHPNNILSNIKSGLGERRVRYLLADFFLIIRKKLVYQYSISEFNKLYITTESTVNGFSPSFEYLLFNLGSINDHPLLVKWQCGFNREVCML
jgi:hypothetical protein